MYEKLAQRHVTNTDGAIVELIKFKPWLHLKDGKMLHFEYPDMLWKMLDNLIWNTLRSKDIVLVSSPSSAPTTVSRAPPQIFHG